MTEQAAGPSRASVKPFTKASRERYESKTVQLVRDYGFQPRRKLSVEDGAVLPRKYEPFPTKLYGRPLEEIDHFIYEEVYKCITQSPLAEARLHCRLPRAQKNYPQMTSWNRTV